MGRQGLDDSDGYVRRLAVLAVQNIVEFAEDLNRLDIAVQTKLASLLEDPDWSVRNAAAGTLELILENPVDLRKVVFRRDQGWRAGVCKSSSAEVPPRRRPLFSKFNHALSTME